MIDFQNASYVKLGRIDYSEVASQIDPLLIEGEQGFLAFKGMRDYIVFTSKRIVAQYVTSGSGSDAASNPRCTRSQFITAPRLGRRKVSTTSGMCRATKVLPTLRGEA